MQNAECKMQNAKCRMQNAECKMQNAECKMQNRRCGARAEGACTLCRAARRKSPRRGVNAELRIEN